MDRTGNANRRSQYSTVPIECVRPVRFVRLCIAGRSCQVDTDRETRDDAGERRSCSRTGCCWCCWRRLRPNNVMLSPHRSPPIASTYSVNTLEITIRFEALVYVRSRYCQWLLRPITLKWSKLDPYCLWQKYSPKNLVFRQCIIYGVVGDIRRDKWERVR